MVDILAASIGKALAAVAPHVHAETWIAALEPPMRSANIMTPRRIAMFLGQCSEESWQFTRLVEDLNYSEDGLCRVWPAHFVPGSTLARECAGNPELLANTVYAGRIGNGGEASGDGWTFRGRGLIQLTGRSNCSRFARLVGKPLDSAFLTWCETPEGAAASACWFWADRRLNALADVWDVADVTRAISGAMGNYQSRLRATSAALRALGGVGGAPDRVAPGIALHTPANPLNAPESDADRLNDAQLRK